MIERTPIGINAANVRAFRQGLRELGYVEGEHFVLEYRSADGQDARFPGLAAELIGSKAGLGRVDQATAKDIPVVEFTETLVGASFIDWQVTQLQRLADALGP